MMTSTIEEWYVFESEVHEAFQALPTQWRWIYSGDGIESASLSCPRSPLRRYIQTAKAARRARVHRTHILFGHV